MKMSADVLEQRPYPVPESNAIIPEHDLLRSPMLISSASSFICRMRQWSEQAEAAQFKAARLAQICGVSLRQLQRQFKQAFGYSPQKWLDELRITVAKKRLEAGDSIKQISWELGFRHPSHFCRCFKASNKLTPSQYVLVLRQSDVAGVL
jgi:AraC-like DNA-binding protein